MLGHKSVVDKSLNEEGEGDDIEDKDVEDALAIVLEVGGEHVPLFQEPMSMSLGDCIHSKALHSRHIGVGVKIVLSRPLAVQTNGQKISLELLHHRLEVIVVETVLVTEPSRLEHAVNQLSNLLITESPVMSQEVSVSSLIFNELKNYRNKKSK